MLDDVLSKIYSSVYRSIVMYYKKGYKSDNWVDLLATKIAEVRLSELGYHFIPGIAPYFKRVRKLIESKALIVKKENQ